jgi:hypothetical protein
MSDIEPPLPPGTRLVLGQGIAAITDEPDYVQPVIGTSKSPDVFASRIYTKGVGYGDTPESATLAAIADYTAKKAAR